MSRSVATAVAIAALAIPGTGAAQPADAQAEVLFRQGKELMTAGKIAEACAAFDASQRLDPKVTTLMNRANCREKNDQLATAWGLFVEAMRQTRSATDVAGVQMHAVATERAAKLEPRLSSLRIDVPDENRIPGLEVLRDGDTIDAGMWNKALPIDGGSFVITARAPGNAAWSTTVVVKDERDVQAVEVPRLRPIAIDARGGGTRSMWTGRRQIAVEVASGGAIALAVGAVLGVSANGLRDDAHALCSDPAVACADAARANELIRSGHDRAIYADVALGIGGAAAIVAGVLWFTGAPERGMVVAPRVGPGEAGLVVGGRF